MPLYTVTTQAGVLSGKAKAKLAAELTAQFFGMPAHSE
jgi:phenylpyruvate tautomerase PptA (4-oxalocrotonate tautomerase family)